MEHKYMKMFYRTVSFVCVFFLSFLLFFSVCHAEPSNPDAEENEVSEKIEELDLADSVYQMGSMEGISGEYAVDSKTEEEICDLLDQAADDFAEEIDIEEYDLSVEEITELTAEFINRNPQYFYLSGVSVEIDEDYISKVYFSYENNAQDKEREYEQAVAAILQGVNPSWSEIAKLMYIHDYITTNCSYDLNLEKRTAYDCLVGKNAVCTGYALAFMDVANRAGIETKYVTSGTLRHAWNIVCIDGDYFYVDCTWDDPVFLEMDQVTQNYAYKMYSQHKFFLKSQDAFAHGETDWLIDGEQVYGLYNDTEYDNACWHDSVSVSVSSDGLLYVLLEGKLYLCSPENISGTMIVQIPANIYTYHYYGSVVSVGDLIFAGNENQIYLVNPANESTELVYELSDDQTSLYGEIYGIERVGSRLRYDMGSGPRITEYNGSDYVDVSAYLDGNYAEVKLDNNYILFTDTTDSVQLTANVTPEGKTVIWQSSNPEVATVDNSGLVQAVGYGRTVITASVGAFKDICIVNIDTVWQQNYQFANEEDFQGKSVYLYLDKYLSDEENIVLPRIGYVNGESYIVCARGKYITYQTSDQINRLYKGLFTEKNLESFSTEEGICFGDNASACFRLCTNLKTVDLSGCDVSKVTTVNSMFYGCSSLESVNFSGCRFENLQTAVLPFGGCTNLKYIQTPEFVPEGVKIPLPCEMYVMDDEGGLSEESYTDLGKAPSNCLLSIYYENHSSHVPETDYGYPATCTQPGLTDGSHCSVCGMVLEEQTVIPPKGHTIVTDPRVDPTYEKTGLTEGSHCSECNTVFKEQNVIPMLSGWRTIENKQYYYENGKKITGWKAIDGKWYYFDSVGVKCTGWVLVKEKWYYLNASGVMQTGWIQYANKWYYLNSSGDMRIGWLKSGNTWYFLNSTGEMCTGWKKVDGGWYYFMASGAMKTGWLKYGGNWYYLTPSGAMKTGWLKEGGVWYYFTSDGVMVTGSRKIGNKTYNFNSSGACLNP
jgi:hypothetical protein